MSTLLYLFVLLWTYLSIFPVQILQKAESEVAAYDDQIVILWMTLSQLCQTYKTLTKCKERNDLYQHIFL